MSFKEGRKIVVSETLTKRRNSDIDLQVGNNSISNKVLRTLSGMRNACIHASIGA